MVGTGSELRFLLKLVWPRPNAAANLFVKLLDCVCVCVYVCVSNVIHAITCSAWISAYNSVIMNDVNDPCTDEQRMRAAKKVRPSPAWYRRAEPTQQPTELKAVWFLTESLFPRFM